MNAQSVIESIAIIGAVATVIAGLGGAGLGAFITYKVGINLSSRNMFNGAAAKFRNAFVDVMVSLEFGITADEPAVDNIKINDFLRKFAAEQLKAIIEFKPFLTECERIGTEKAWYEYCHPDGIPEDKETFIEWCDELQ